ncbi:MAG: hypothetical protein NT167_08300 [Verrucomicrobia bacterium]|nr:hypothetical protein [Verrucomicrobiota bacterium]
MPLLTELGLRLGVRFYKHATPTELISRGLRGDAYQSNQFSFGISGPAASGFVVDASTNLAPVPSPTRSASTTARDIGQPASRAMRHNGRAVLNS